MAELPYAELLVKAKRLRSIQFAGAGIDHFFRSSDVDAAWRKSRSIMRSGAAGEDPMGRHV